MSRLTIVFLLVATVLVLSEAQLTFSSGWGQGKRSVSSDTRDSCSSEATIYAIYKLIENEAEKLLACQSDLKN